MNFTKNVPTCVKIVYQKSVLFSSNSNQSFLALNILFLQDE